VEAAVLLIVPSIASASLNTWRPRLSDGGCTCHGTLDCSLRRLVSSAHPHPSAPRSRSKALNKKLSLVPPLSTTRKQQIDGNS